MITSSSNDHYKYYIVHLSYIKLHETIFSVIV